MDWSLLAGFAAMAAVIEISPGPNFFLIIRSVPTFGKLGALAIFTGFGISYTMHGALAIYGVSALLNAEPFLLLIIQIAGAGYLLFLGIKSFVPVCQQKTSSDLMAEAVDILLAPVSNSFPVRIYETPLQSQNVFSSEVCGFSSNSDIDILLESTNTPTCINGLFTCFRDGLFISALNPKITLFYLAVFPQFIQESTDTVASSFFLVLTHITICGLWISVVTQLLEYALKKTASQCFVEQLTRFSGVALIGLAVAFFSSALKAL